MPLGPRSWHAPAESVLLPAVALLRPGGRPLQHAMQECGRIGKGIGLEPNLLGFPEQLDEDRDLRSQPQ